MKKTTKVSFKGSLLIAGALVALSLGTADVVRAQGMSCGQHKQHGETTKAPGVPSKKAVNQATITIDGGYTPSSLTVKVGKPVELTFVRKSKGGCDGDLVFPSLNVRKNLKPGEKTVIKFTPKKTGTIMYSCGMGMYKGNILVK